MDIDQYRAETIKVFHQRLPFRKNHVNVRFKLTFIRASALVAMRSTYLGQLVQASAAPLILHMCTYLGGVAYA